MSDMWPRRNLGTAENWGRAIERRFDALKARIGIQSQSRNGLGRYASATAESIAELIEIVRTAIVRYLTKYDTIKIAAVPYRLSPKLPEKVMMSARAITILGVAPPSVTSESGIERPLALVLTSR